MPASTEQEEAAKARATAEALLKRAEERENGNLGSSSSTTPMAGGMPSPLKNFQQRVSLTTNQISSNISATVSPTMNQISTNLNATGSRITSGIKAEVSELNKDIQSTKEDISNVLAKAGESLKKAGDTTIGKARQGMKKAGDSTMEGMKKAGESMKKAGDNTIEGMKKAGESVKQALRVLQALPNPISVNNNNKNSQYPPSGGKDEKILAELVTLEMNISLCQSLLSDPDRSTANGALPSVANALVEWVPKLNDTIQHGVDGDLQPGTLDVALASRDRLQITLEQCSSFIGFSKEEEGEEQQEEGEQQEEQEQETKPDEDDIL